MMGQNSCSRSTAWQLVQCRKDESVDLDRGALSATVVGSKIYLFGGRRGRDFFNDLLVFDTATASWSKAGPPCPYKPRANHTGTLVGKRIWFIGGMDMRHVFDNVFCYDLNSNSWHQPTIGGPVRLLQRCAHAAEVHPRYPNCILIMGGYGNSETPACETEEKRGFVMTNDVLLLHTDRLVLEHLPTFKGVPPTPRGYHSMSIVGGKAYIFGGRCTEKEMVNDRTLLSIFDTVSNSWIAPNSVAGTLPSPRSSHRTAVYNGRIVLFGGTGEDKGVKARVSEVYSLVLGQGGQHLVWCQCDMPCASPQKPDGRAAHIMCIVDRTLYVMCGYAGTNSSKDKAPQNDNTGYAADCWSLQLLPDAYERWLATSASNRPEVAAVLQQAACGKRAANSGTAAPQRNRSKSPRNKSGVPAADSGPAVGAALADADETEASRWRVAKRQRSGGSGPLAEAAAAAAAGAVAGQGRVGSGGLNPCQQQHHEQHSPRHQRHQKQQQAQPVPPPRQQYQQQQQPQQVCNQQAVQAAAVAAAMVAAHAAGAGSGVAFDMRTPSSPNYNAGEYIQQQELENLREQLQRQVSRTSCLEGENRQLSAQLRDLKADKLAAEQQVQQLQGDSLRQKLSKEQAVKEQLRAQEDLVVLQQQLEAAKQRISKLEAERDQVVIEKQGLYKESQRMSGLKDELERDKRQLQEQLREQLQQQRATEEKHVQDQQLQQQSIVDMHATVEQTKNELKRMNDCYVEQQRKHDAAVAQLRGECTAREAQLQEKARLAADLAQQLEAVKAALADEQRKAESFRQLHQTSTQQLETLRQSHMVQASEKSRLESELAKFKDDHDRLKSQLEQKASGANQARAVALQVQQQMAQLMNALG